MEILRAWLMGAWAGSSLMAAESGWEVLFDGTATAAFRGYRQATFPSNEWVVEHGTLKAVPGARVDLITQKQYQDFELEFEWKVSAGANSGVMYRVAESSAKPWHTGPEMQLLDDEEAMDGQNAVTRAGALYCLLAPNPNRHLRPVGQFNQAKILVHKNRVEHWINGLKVVAYEWGSPAMKALIPKTKFKDYPQFMAQAAGHIVFQHHGHEVWFRNIRIREQ